MLIHDVPDVAALSLFVSVVQLGSISRAAAAHGITQPSATNRLRRLEQSLGLVLLDRDGSGSRPTAAGRAVVEPASRVLREAEQLRATTLALRHQPGNRLQMVASFTIAETLLPRWLADFQRQHSGVAIELDVANSTIVLDRVLRADAELGFIESPGTTRGLESCAVGADELVVVVPPGHRLARRRTPLDPKLLAELALVVRERGSGTREAFEEAQARAGASSRTPAAAELGSAAAVRAAVMAGSGPGVVSRLAVESELESGRLRLVPIAGVDLQRTLRAVWRRGELSRSGQALLRSLRSSAPEQP